MKEKKNVVVISPGENTGNRPLNAMIGVITLKGRHLGCGRAT